MLTARRLLVVLVLAAAVLVWQRTTMPSDQASRRLFGPESVSTLHSAPQPNSSASSSQAVFSRQSLPDDSRTASSADANDSDQLPELRVPVVVHLVKNSGPVTSRRTMEDVRQVLAEAQRIWRPAGVKLEPTFIETELSASQIESLSQGVFQALYSHPDCCQQGAHLFFVRQIDGPDGRRRANGLALPPSLAVVADLTTVNDYRTAAHELGHLLGLEHDVESPRRLMFRGENGEEITAEEMRLVRRQKVYATPSQSGR